MRIHARFLPAILALFFVAACDSYDDDDDGLACTLEARPGISVTVMIDGNGGVPDDGVYEVTITDGSYTETEAVVNGEAHLAYERAGTYDVVVTAGGNTIWTRNDVVVTEDECHVHTEELTVLVEPGG